MIKEYSIATNGAQYIRFQVFKPQGMINEDCILPEESIKIDKYSWRRFFREKIYNKEMLILRDTVKQFPIFRTFIYDDEKGMYKDTNDEAYIATEFLIEVCDNKHTPLRLVEPIGDFIIKE